MPSIPAQALYEACAAGDAAAVSRLLPAGGTRLNLSRPRFQAPNTKRTPLIAAAACGHTEIVRMILERAPNTSVGQMDANDDTALLLAACYHHADTVRLLTDNGGNVNQVVGQRNPPLRAAICEIHPDDPPRDPDPDGARELATVRALLRLGAAPDSVDGVGMTPLCCACHLGLAQVLLARGAKIDFVTPPLHKFPGFTPLMYAAAASHAGVAKSLLKSGADGTKTATCVTRRGDFKPNTALDIARLLSDLADGGPAVAETFTVLRRRCCSTCGMTSPGRATKTAGEQTHLRRCSECPARGCRARYCDEVCQRADWVSRHRGECAEARRARQAAGAEV